MFRNCHFHLKARILSSKISIFSCFPWSDRVTPFFVEKCLPNHHSQRHQLAPQLLFQVRVFIKNATNSGIRIPMSTAALFTNLKHGGNPVSTDKWRSKMWCYPYNGMTMEFSIPIKKRMISFNSSFPPSHSPTLTCNLAVSPIWKAQKVECTSYPLTLGLAMWLTRVHGL